jgi:hypothetical protein
MDGSLKSKLTSWSATVGLAALSLLGNAGGAGLTGNNSAQAVSQNEVASGTNTAGSAVVPADTAAYEVAQSSPPPPPPRPPAVGAVRG